LSFGVIFTVRFCIVPVACAIAGVLVRTRVIAGSFATDEEPNTRDEEDRSVGARSPRRGTSGAAVPAALPGAAA
jgi:hypothetical protein